MSGNLDGFYSIRINNQWRIIFQWKEGQSEYQGIPQTRTSAILKGKRGVTADTALRLSLYFGTSPKFWLGLQDDFDLEEALKNKQAELSKIKKAENYAA